MTTWDTADLQRRLCHALDIARRTVERLGASGYTDTEEFDERIRPEKIISETALLLLAASKAGGDAVAARVRGLGALLIPHARSERIRLALCMEPALALDYASAHICLTRLGHRDAEFDGLLRQALQSQARNGRERVPHRDLEQQWLQAGWSGRRDAPEWHSLARSSALNQPIDLLCGSRDDLYAFTHAILYASDFNIAPQPLPRSRTAILAEAESALARCLDDQDYDLSGEVLLAWPLTGRSWSAAAAFGFRVLARVEDQAGFLPAPITRIQRLDELEGDHRTNYLLATAYHTAYVMGLLCAAALQAGRTPPVRIAASSVRRGSAERILTFLDAGGRRPHWREELDALSRRERDSLAGLLLTIALRRATVGRDFAAMAMLLREGNSLGLTDRPAASQAAQMLQRLSLLALRPLDKDCNPQYIADCNEAR